MNIPMPPVTRLLRTLAASLLAASLLLSGGSGHMVLANGVGDIYVADPAAVLELNTGSGGGTVSIDAHICVPGGQVSAAAASAGASTAPSGSPEASAAAATTCSSSVKAPTQLAFSANTADLQKLYLATANGTPDIYRINIVDLTVQAPVTMSANVTAIAHPKGDTLYVALAGSTSLMYLGDSDTTPSSGVPMSKGVPDILAADARDTHVVAAKAGESWVAIVNASGSVYPVLPAGGKVVAAAIARDEGAAYVATSSPNRLYRIDLTKHTILWTATLPETPTAVAALDHYAVVSAGPKLYKVQKSGASLWATAAADVTQLGADLDAGYVYIATADTLVARSVAAPADNVASLPLPDGAVAAMAPVPNKASNLPAVHGKPAASSGTNGNGTTTGTAKPHKTRAPSTDTISDLVAGKSVDITTLLLVLGSVVIVTTFGSRWLIKRLVKA